MCFVLFLVLSIGVSRSFSFCRCSAGQQSSCAVQLGYNTEFKKSSGTLGFASSIETDVHIIELCQSFCSSVSSFIEIKSLMTGNALTHAQTCNTTSGMLDNDGQSACDVTGHSTGMLRYHHQHGYSSVFITTVRARELFSFPCVPVHHHHLHTHFRV